MAEPADQPTGLARYGDHVREALGRGLDTEDLAVASSLAEVTEAQPEVGRRLTASGKLLGLHYLRAIVPTLTFPEAVDAFDHVFLRHRAATSWRSR